MFYYLFLSLAAILLIVYFEVGNNYTNEIVNAKYEGPRGTSFNLWLRLVDKHAGKIGAYSILTLISLFFLITGLKEYRRNG